MRGYSKIKLKYIASIFNGNSIPDDKKDNYCNKAIPYIPTKELNLSDGEINYNNGLSVSESDGFRIAPKESVLLCIEGGSAGKKIGITDRPVAFVNKLCCIHGKKIASKLLYYCLKSKDFIDQFALSMTGMIGGVTVSDLKNIEVSVPEDTGLQKKLTETISERSSIIDRYIKNEEQQIEKFKQYKQSLISEVVTKGLDPNTEMKDSGIPEIGWIPHNWELKRVKYVATTALSKGNGITKEEVHINGNTQCIRYGEIYSKYDFSLKEAVSRTNNEQLDKPVYVSKGDILFAGTGELVEEIGKNVAYLGDDKCLVGGDIIILKHSQDAEFLSYSLNSISSQLQKSKGKAKLKVVHISADDIGNIMVSLPPFETQKQIANYLNEKCRIINALIAKKETKITKLEQYKKSLIYEYVTGKKEVV